MSKRCPRCGETKPLSEYGLTGRSYKSYCRACCARLVRLWRARHSERAREINRQSYARKREPLVRLQSERTARQKASSAWKQRNSERVRIYQQMWRAANSEHVGLYQREWMERHGLRLGADERVTREQRARRRAVEAEQYRRMAPHTASRRPLMNYPYLSASLHAVEGEELLVRVNNLVPRLDNAMRADVCQDLILAVLSGAIQVDELGAHHVTAVVKRQFAASAARRMVYLDSLSARARENVEIYAQELAAAWK